MIERLPAVYLGRIGSIEDWTVYLHEIEAQAMARMKPGSLIQVLDAVMDCIKARKDRYRLIREGMKEDDSQDMM